MKKMLMKLFGKKNNEEATKEQMVIAMQESLNIWNQAEQRKKANLNKANMLKVAK